MDIKIGKVYKVIHSRKGEFTIRIDEDGEFIIGVIISGYAKVISRYNVVREGETISLRKAFCTFVEL